MHSAFSIQHSALFITGTDTGVGKSIVSAMLALMLLEQGKKIAISKPIQTGSNRDTDLLKELTGNKIDIFNTYSFSLPSAPLVAARFEKKDINVEKIISDIKSLEEKYDCVIVEGIGGIAVPLIEPMNLQIKNHYLVADLIKALNYPTIIVARPNLGTINHTVLTIEFAKQKELNLLGFVISGYDENTFDPAIKTAPEIISDITEVKCMFKFAKVKEISYNSIVKSLATGQYVC